MLRYFPFDLICSFITNDYQGSASDCVLVVLLAARYAAIKGLKKKFPFEEDGVLLSKLMAYCSKEVSGTLISSLKYFSSNISSWSLLLCCCQSINRSTCDVLNFYAMC